MRKAVLLAAVVAMGVSGAVLADNTLAQKEFTAKTAKPVAPKASKAVRLSDAELDKITAGDATHFTGHGFTLIFNPGNANVLKFHKQGLTCINCIPAP